MKKIKMSLSRPEDDLSLQKVMRDNFLEGNIRVSFGRHPNFFHSIDILGDSSDVMVSRNMNDEAVGFGIRSEKKVFINGELKKIGYLSGLRLNSEYRGGLALFKSYKFFKEIDNERNTPFYFSTVMAENKLAIDILESGRSALPVYERMGDFNTYAIHLPIKKLKHESSDIEIKRLDIEKLDDVRIFLNEINSKKQFAPYFDETFLISVKCFRGMSERDVYVAFVKGEIVGVLGKWDQSSYKQNIISGYSKKMKVVRRFYNLYSRLVGKAPLPDVGSEIKSFYLSFLAIKNNDEKIFQALLARILNDCKKEEYSYFLVALSSQDPLLKCFRNYSKNIYRGIFYGVYWDENKTEFEKLDERPFYHDIALM